MKISGVRAYLGSGLRMQAGRCGAEPRRAGLERGVRPSVCGFPRFLMLRGLLLGAPPPGSIRAEIPLRVSEGDVAHHAAEELEVVGHFAVVRPGAEDVAKDPAEIFVARVREEAARVGEHPDEAREEPCVCEDAHLRFHAVDVVEEPPAGAELDLAGLGLFCGVALALEAAHERGHGIQVLKVEAVEDGLG